MRTRGSDKAGDERKAVRVPAVTTTEVPTRQRPDLSSPQGLRALQGTTGNAAVVQLLRRAGHSWAREEHRHSAYCGHQSPAEPTVQRSAVHDVLRAPGQPLDSATRADMEARLGADFSDVRIHDDSVARASAAEVGARAYTSGSHVVIGDGGADEHTLAHELTHVIQQRQGPVAGTDNGGGLRVSDPSDRFEQAAEANAHRVMSGPAQPAVQRAADAPRSSAESRGAHEAHSGAVVQRAPGEQALFQGKHWKDKMTGAGFPQSLGLRAPHDLAVIGVDDIPSSALLRPSLTTVVRDTDTTLARGLARRVVDALDRKEAPADPVEDTLRVEVRDSA